MRGSPDGDRQTWRRVDVGDAVHLAAFRSALRVFQRRSERIAHASGLTPQRYLLLLMIKGAPGGKQRSTVSELVRRLQLAQSTVTELVARAEHAGLVARKQSRDDGRVVYLRLTEEGERRLAEAFRGHELERAALREAFAELGE